MSRDNKLKIEIWSDVMCPFCYIGKRKIENVINVFPNKNQVEIEWKSFQLDPRTKSQPGKSTYDYLAEKYGRDRQWSVEMHENVSNQAKAEGLEFNFDKAIIANSFDAHRLSHLAKKLGKGNELEELIFKAYFTDGKDVSEIETLVELGKNVDLDENEIRNMLDSNQFKEEVQNDMIEAQQIGVRGVPFFVLDRKYAISGAQPPEVFAETLEKAWENWTGNQN